MLTKTKVESTWDSGDPKSLRDEDGGLWRVVVNPGDGTLAVEEIEDRIDTQIEDRETVGMTPCGIARWNLDGTLTIFRVNGHGENYTDPKEYQDGSTVWIATPSGWGVLAPSSEMPAVAMDVITPQKVTVHYWIGTTQYEDTAETYEEAMEFASRNRNAWPPTFYDENGNQLFDDGRGLREADSDVYAM